MTTTPTSGWFTGRTKLVTIASIGAVAVAGAIAVGANIGILNAAADTHVGNLSATGDLATPSTQVIYVDDPAPTTAATAPDPATQAFTVDAAGSVSITSLPTGLRLDTVSPTPGWSWSVTQTTTSELMVTFTDGTRTLEFTAALQPDGSIGASVNEPIVAAAPTPTASSTHHDEYEGGGDDD